MPQVKVFMQPFANPKERQQFLMNMAISAEFEMRNRGLVLYYGKDLIAYKREKPTDKNRNEFLRVFSKFMTDNLEDNCPPSWKECQPAFWEEFIFTFYPHLMNITPNENQVETFLYQLKKFVRWLDKRVGTTWYPIIQNYAEEAAPELKICERLLNELFLLDYPKLHQNDWNPLQDIEKITQDYDQCADKLSSVFEVTSMIEDTVVLTDFKTKRTYYVKGLPNKLIVPGIIMNGLLGKRSGDLAWNWYHTESIYPQRGKNFITFAN